MTSSSLVRVRLLATPKASVEGSSVMITEKDEERLRLNPPAGRLFDELPS
jgi:hypothetical protein